MKAIITIGKKEIKVDFSKPIDISIPLEGSKENPIAWYLDAPKIQPVSTENFIAKVSEGASVNFNNITFNPHSHGTHTECVGHITEDFYSVNEALNEFFFISEVISIIPETKGKDTVISKEQIQEALQEKKPKALVIRTIPNTSSKKTRNYSNTNWSYLEKDAATYIREIGVEHLLIDLPSVDKEYDDGHLLAHRAFWNVPKAIRYNATITEFIFVPSKTKDGTYLLNLQMASFQNDASPSKPVLYKIE